MKIEELKKEYAKQDNRATAYPTYVMVQEQVSIGVMAEGYSVNCPYGDGETRVEYCHPDIEETYQEEDKAELINDIRSWSDDDEINDEEIKKIEEINVGYIWHPVEFFLTIKGAEEYMKANAHNHGKLRTYVGYFERRNFEMRELLNELGFKTRD